MRLVSIVLVSALFFAPLAILAQEETQITFDPAEDTLPAWSPDGERIAFVSDRSGNRDIWTIPASGGIATQVTTHAGEDTDPSWSPDGGQIVFGSDRSGNGDLWVIPANGGTATQITFDPAWDGDPDWSPDGTTIAFTSDRGVPAGYTEIWVMAATGGVASQLTTDGGGFAEWSPDGSQIAYLPGVGYYRSISLIPATGGDPTPVGTPSLAGSLAWSPDGISLAFSWMIENLRRAIHTVAVAVGGAPFQETFPGYYGVDEHPTWSPDGSQIAFARNWLCGTGCSWDIWVIDVGPPISVDEESWGSIKAEYRE